MKYILLLALLIPFVFAGPLDPSMCATLQGCQEGYPQTVCEAISPSQYWPPTTDPSVYATVCTTGCCDLGGGQEQNLTGFACADQGGTFNANTACDPTVQVCLAGQTNCVCEGTTITDTDANPYCCPGQNPNTQSDPTCGGTTGTNATALCGNGIRDPIEQCDYNAQNPIEGCPVGSVQSCSINCRCTYDPGRYGNSSQCNPPGNTGSGCAGPLPCSSQLQNATLTADPVVGIAEALTTWDPQISPSCTSTLTVSNYVISYREDVSGSTWTGASLSASTTTYNVPVQADTDYIIQIDVWYAGVPTPMTTRTTFSAGNAECFRPERQFCDVNEVVTCGTDNKKQLPQVFCNPDPNILNPTNCMPTSTGAACLPLVDCDECNAAYESFGENLASKSITITDPSGSSTYQCSQLDSGVNIGGVSATVCYLDQSYSALKEYISCNTIATCYDYNAQTGCTNDPCVAPGTCEWTSQGICRPQETEYQICSGSTQNECSATGSNCIWCGDAATGSCRDTTSTASCGCYATQSACTNHDGSGGGNFAVNSNTNVPTQISNDQLGFGKCKWNAANSLCEKDADDDGFAESDSDFTNPTTTIMSDVNQPFPSDVVISYVTDEPSDTYAELLDGQCPGSITSRPPTKVSSGTMTFNGKATGDYCLRYYSEDKQSNLEHVQQSTITVDTSQLLIQNVRHQIFPWPAVFTSDLDIQFDTSRTATCDAKLRDSNGYLPEQLTGAVGSAFGLYFIDLPDEQYVLEINCWLSNGASAQHSESIVLDIDNRITEPRPLMNTYTPNQVVTYMIHTAITGSCNYVDHLGQRTNFGSPSPVTINGVNLFRHQAAAPLLTSGYYELPVQCTFSGVTLDGGPGDSIKFAVDEGAPVTTAEYLDSQGNLVAAGSIIIAETATDVTLTCADTPSIPGQGTELNAGCDNLYLKGPNDNSFTSVGTKNPDGTITYTYSLLFGETIEFYSDDTLGNTETSRTVTGTSADMTCSRQYFTQADCLGSGSDFALDHSDNTVTSSSGDANGFGKCKWVNNACHKDSDDNNAWEYDTDFDNPITTITTDTSNTFPSTVIVDFSLSEPGITFAEITSGSCGAVQKPTSRSAVQLPAGALVGTFTFNNVATGNHCIHYYSKDYGNNTEAVQQEQISVHNLRILNFVDTQTPITNGADLSLDVTISASATCTGTLEGFTEGPITSTLNGDFGSNFVIDFPGLNEDQYTFRLTCSQQGIQSLDETRVVVVDVDREITLPVPTLGTYLNSDVANLGGFGVHTTDTAATCEYNDGSWNSLPLTTTVTVGGTTYRKHQESTTLNSGFYDFPVRCTLVGGSVETGSSADNIRFAIDETPPGTVVTITDANGNPQQIGGTLIAPPQGKTLNIYCVDPPIFAPNGNQYESNVCKIYLESNGGGFTELTGGIYTIIQNEVISIYSEDALGNTESTRTITAQAIDISGPERPTFGVVP